MCKADFYGSSIADDQRLEMYVGDVINDADAYDGMVFTKFYADCMWWRAYQLGGYDLISVKYCLYLSINLLRYD